MSDGLRVVKVIRGRHSLGITDDSDIQKANKTGWQTWRTELRKLKVSKVDIYEKAGNTGKRLI